MLDLRMNNIGMQVFYWTSKFKLKCNAAALGFYINNYWQVNNMNNDSNYLIIKK
jgi:hypothetical protein